MKAIINKSEVMKKAWGLYRLFNRYNKITKTFYNNKIIKSFSYCLKRAWEAVKIEMTRLVVEPVSYITQEAYDSFYSNAKYFGD